MLAMGLRKTGREEQRVRSSDGQANSTHRLGKDLIAVYPEVQVCQEFPPNPCSNTCPCSLVRFARAQAFESTE